MKEQIEQFMENQKRVRSFRAAIPSGNNVKDRRAALVAKLLIQGLKNSDICSLKASEAPPHTGEKYIPVKLWSGRIRRIMLGDELLREMADYFDNIRPLTMPRRLGRTSPSGWFFYARGQKMTSQQVTYILQKISKAAGLEKTIEAKMLREIWIDEDAKALIG